MIDWLLRRLADRLGVESARAGEAITPRIRFEQPWPQALALFVVLGAAALIVWIYRREGDSPWPYRALLGMLRLVLVLLAVFMLSEAVLSVERTGLPYFVVMVDDSASGRIADQYEDPASATAASALAKAAGASEPRRLDVARGWLEADDAKVLRSLQERHKVKLYLVSNGARPLAEIGAPADVAPALEKLKGVEANGAQTRLGDGVRQVLTELRGAPPSAIVLLTDGRTTDGEALAQAADLAARKGVPLFPVGLGDPRPARDLELADLLVEDVVFVEDQVRFQAKLLARGFAGQDVVVRLKERPADSDPAQAREIESIRLVAPPDGEPKRFEINHRPKQTGSITYVIEVEPRPRELQVENNRLERTITVRKEKLKVLLVDSEPRYEFRYVKNYLERDETIDLNVVLLASDPEYSEQDRTALPTFPAAKDDLFKYDVVVIGDADPSFLSSAQMRNIAEFVTEKGGGVLFVAGELFNPIAYRGTPLELLLPVELAELKNPSAQGRGVDAFRPVLTLEGRVSPIFRFGDDEATSLDIQRHLPEQYWLVEAARKKPAAIVLAEHPTLTGRDGKLPVFVYQFVGAGKAMLNTIDDTWRWRYRAGDRYFGRFWVQTLRFLARSKLVGRKQAELESDRKRYQRNQPVQIRARFPNPGLTPTGGEVAVQVERKGHGSRRVTLKSSPGAPTVFEGVLSQSPEGRYEVRLLPPPVLDGPIPTAEFEVVAPAGEFERIAMNEPELTRAAEISSGKFYTPLTVGTMLRDLPKPRKVPLDTDPPIPLWNSWAVLLLFLCVITAEWLLRKRKQLV